MNTPIFENRATLDINPPAAEQADLSQDDYMVFAMQDKHHQFTLGLSTILECLHAAEQEGAVPALPESWWLALSTRYNLDYLQHSN